MVKDRVVKLIELKGVAKESFYKKIGVTSANFRGKARESDLGCITISKILKEFPDINLYWLITGAGDMFINDKYMSMNNENSNGTLASNINGNNGNITISHNDFNNIMELKKNHQEIERKLLNRLKKSQKQTNKLLEILSKK